MDRRLRRDGLDLHRDGGVDDFAQPVVPAQEEVAGLRQAQRQQIARPPVDDRGVALGREHRILLQPGPGGRDVRENLRAWTDTLAFSENAAQTKASVSRRVMTNLPR